MTLSRLGSRRARWSSLVIWTPVLPSFRQGTTGGGDQAGAFRARALRVRLMAEAVAIASW
jgi:hypothetical protein